jgi:hypothetical protein
MERAIMRRLHSLKQKLGIEETVEQ